MKETYFTGRYKAFLFALLFSGALLSCQENDKDLVKPKTVTDVISENEQFSTLNEIITGIKGTDAFRTENFTFFAPNNTAFLRAGLSSTQVLGWSKDSVNSFLKYHTLAKRKTAADLKEGKYTMLNGQELTIQKGLDTTTVTINNNAVIVQKNVNTDGGIIQVVDQLLIIKK
ncbi:fasciclin domain-containing protein [Dyadobacter sp. CY312]|uniref:fasciclin domain-containing protein n=1 Tax=Dyadobacter sp. CY312 TaxID=2907303 RepID=UPI001F15A0E7|nr:fasciclin domain-containing protein [Dyadobacter sp. CY312]MCE7043704.1 fasciclin domain-containing protein [Dyadobacter sp. CY312]